MSDRFTVNLSLLVVRLFAGGIFTVHGLGKMFGVFGGPGLSGMAQHLGFLGYLVSIGEFFGGLALIVGVLTRFSSASLIVIMIGAILKVHGENGFFNLNPATQKIGYEYNLALIGLMLPTFLAGPGALSFVRATKLPRIFE